MINEMNKNTDTHYYNCPDLNWLNSASSLNGWRTFLNWFDVDWGQEDESSDLFLGSLFSHYGEQQLAQVPAGLQQQILQIASMPTMQTTHMPPVASTPIPIQPKPTPKPIAPATMNPSLVSHKQSFQSKVRRFFLLDFVPSSRRLGQRQRISCPKCRRICPACQCAPT